MNNSEAIDVEEVINISSAPITSVLSFTMSLTRKFALIGTQNGFCIVQNAKKSFQRFESNSSGRENKNTFRAEPNTGVKLGTVLEERAEVAIIPSK
jgi:hypothetical protein